ncbi:MAG TPA: hypothetical protein VFB55_09360 [Verrucomicrobiae bacterium]|nr:hypothetical protein [Verrucomicrobiae bacterium]
MKQRAKRCRWAGVLVLVLGLAAAAGVFLRGTRDRDLSDDPARQGFRRAERQQMGLLYGKSGLWIDGFWDDLKQPATQSVLIAAVSVLTTGICFYFARLLETDDEPDGGKDG